MTIQFYLILFFACAFAGWVLDSGYRSLIARRWQAGGFSRLPLCPSYGFGGVLLVWLVPHVSNWPLVLQLILFTLALTTLEYVSGVYSVTILKKRLWDYSKSRLNLHGHIDILHAFYWLILSAVFRLWIYPLL